MRKLIAFWENTWRNLGFVRVKSKSRKCNQAHVRCMSKFETLESRELLADMTWIGTDLMTWDSIGAWAGGAQFSAGDRAIFSSDMANKTVIIPENVRPSAIVFEADGYELKPQSATSGSISAFGSTLTIQVNQQTITSDVIATISAPITNPTGGITQLVVDATGSDPDSGIDNDGNYFPTGTLILKGANTYGADDLTTNYTVIKGYSHLKPDYTLTYTGGILVAGSPDALPKDGNTFRTIRVEAAGTLAVENDGTANGTNGKWTNDTIPMLFSSNPYFEGNETLRSNFGIWVDEGKSFDYMQTIPGNSGGSENLNENFMKLGVGTLTVSGDNRRESPHFGYPGTTSVNKGTLITAKPEALPRYGVSGQVMVRNTIPDPDVSNMNKFFECSC